MRGRIGDEQRIAHIHEAIEEEEIEQYIKGISSADFKSKSVIKFASIKQIEIIGEAARYIRTKQRVDIQLLSGKKLRV